MEECYKKRINDNIVSLIKNTDCNTLLLANLLKAQVIGNSDLEELEDSGLSRLKRSKRLYEILQTRTNSFNIFLKALNETNQSGAHAILISPPSKFQNYGLILVNEKDILGKGSYGTIVCRGMFDGRKVAVKKVNTQANLQQDAYEEVEFLRHVDNHENIIRYYMAEMDQQFIHIALELCLISLEDEVKLKLVKLSASTILQKCTRGVHHLHKLNIIHGDLKPANILLNHPDIVKVSDFGFSKSIPAGESSVTIPAIVGTVEWMAPEILDFVFCEEAEGQKLKMTTATDIFSLGCVFFFTLTDGKHPFGQPGDRVYHIRRNIPQLDQVKVSTSGMELVHIMICRDPKSRIQTDQILLNKYFQNTTDQSTSSANFQRHVPTETVSDLKFQSRNEPQVSKIASAKDRDILNERICIKLERWIKQSMNLTNISHILHALDSVGASNLGIKEVYQTIKHLDEKFQDIFKHIICFHGELERKRMIQLQQAAYSDVVHTLTHDAKHVAYSKNILEAANAKLIQIYDDNNAEIVANEILLIEEATSQICHMYIIKMKHYARDITITDVGLQVVRQKMEAHCVSVLKNCRSFEGRLSIASKEYDVLTAKLKKCYTNISSTRRLIVVAPLIFAPQMKKQLYLLQLYDEELKNALATYASTNAELFKRQHEDILNRLLLNLKVPEIKELELRFHGHLCFVDELAEQLKCKTFSFETGNIIGLLLTSKWVWSAVHTSQTGTQLMGIERSKRTSTRFPSVIALGADMSFCYGPNVKKLPNTKFKGNLIDYICNPATLKARQMIKMFFSAVKSDMESAINYKQHIVSQILIVLPSWFQIDEKNFVRNCCQECGFKKITLLSESSVTAFSALRKLDNAHLIMVVVAVSDGIRMELYRQINAVELLTATSDVWPKVEKPSTSTKVLAEKPALKPKARKRESDELPVEFLKTVDAAYKSILAKFTSQQAVQFYTLITANSEWNKSFDTYFQEKGLTRVDNIRNDTGFLHAFSKLSKDKHREEFVRMLTTIPEEATM